MDPEIDLVADLNAEDDEGLGWSVLSEARAYVCGVFARAIFRP